MNNSALPKIGECGRRIHRRRGECSFQKRVERHNRDKQTLWLPESVNLATRVHLLCDRQVST
ncbi:hypothetical protein PILCRDRAFT_811800 [Piloderma croceum F 1598]|uniref:Uncharacterized protein n=1 Tax=Piloderma croceum (strain F 1598) TaxID=765440 RepID=A0A0C3G1H4_PILCF|nr:hypothetical protein PILCRDRAFT_811800 [Piloderma croceum F 1598]